MRKALVFTVIASISATIWCQEKDETARFSFSHEPFYMIKNILKTDVDIALGSGNWLIISPMFAARENHYEDEYYYYDDYYEDEFNKLLGFGVNVGHRMYGNPIDIPRGIYFMYQAGWRHYKLDYRDRTWGETEFDGYDAITYDYFDMSTTIDKLGLDILIGYQFVIKNALMLDLYLGGGIRYSIKEFAGNQKREFKYNFIDYGYTGLLPQGGVRLGVIL